MNIRCLTVTKIRAIWAQNVTFRNTTKPTGRCNFVTLTWMLDPNCSLYDLELAETSMQSCSPCVHMYWVHRYLILLHLIHIHYIHKLMVPIHWSISTSIITNRFSLFKKWGISSYLPVDIFSTFPYIIIPRNHSSVAHNYSTMRPWFVCGSTWEKRLQ